MIDKNQKAKMVFNQNIFESIFPLSSIFSLYFSSK